MRSICLLIPTLCLSSTLQAQHWSGDNAIWSVLTLTLDGPKVSEKAEPNPFRDYRLSVTFSHKKTQYQVAGYYAADGNAAESSATKGTKWRVHFMPDQVGQWKYTISFRTGKDIALSDDAKAGKPMRPDGMSGTLNIQSLPNNDARAHGRLRYVGKRYLQWSGNGRYYLKGGADSPENFLGYIDFDNTRIIPKKKGPVKGRKLHRYEPHLRDWKPGDPAWKDGKGKGIIGAINYLASKGMNSIYFLTMNVTGDGNDVWPWVEPNVRDRFDCSKLDQWNIVFDHMDRKGIALHVVTQETENDQLLDGGNLGPLRKLYYRELIARFAHHRSVVWNLGEECTNTTSQIKQFSDYIQKLDPYRNPVVVHTYPNKKEQVYKPLLGHKTLDGPSLQFGNDWHRIPQVVHDWVSRSEKAGHAWVVNVDEPGTAKFGLDHDAKKQNNNQDLARKTALWGALMSGGAGVEWYFGYANPHNDLNLEDFRSRERMWNQTRFALEFFQKHVPFHEMDVRNDLVKGKKAQCLAKERELFVVYLPEGGEATLNIGQRNREYDFYWYNPRTGGKLIKAEYLLTKDAKGIQIPKPPKEANQDWVALIRLPR